ncbi:MAG TPA: cytidylate kinase family protein [Chloroflexia bacterium]|nr:cytidylate kinase family protein [Chloroflexia bacterium]
MASKNLVITVSREHGSGGRQIATEVARKLKLPYVDSQIIKMATQQLGIEADELANFDERVLPQLDEISRLVSRQRIGEEHVALSEVLVPEKDAFGLPRRRIETGSVITHADPSLERKAAIHKGYHDLVAALIRDVAARGGAVILGRGSQFVLKVRPNTAHIHVFAPFNVRVERLMHQRNLPRAEAEHEIKESDDQRAGYVRRYYNSDWRDPANYHLVLNTGILSLSAAVNSIVELGHAITTQKPDESVSESYNVMDRESYTLKQASDMLWISQDVLKQAAYRGELKVSIVDHQIHRISRDALLEWLHRGAN